jgi:hypothetical protein
MRTLFLLLFFLISTGSSIGQTESNPLFQNQQPLPLRLSLSFKDIKKNTTDTTFLSSLLYYQQNGIWDSINISVRSRGKFRKKECFFTPLRIKIKKKDALGTPFEGNKSLKLVLPCQDRDDNSKLVIKEYICYKMYDQLSTYTFNTRLAEIELKETSSKKAKDFKISGFFIEDDDLVAKRHYAKVVENENLHPRLLRDTFAIEHDLFQYMISNTDWSTTFLHNSKLIKMEPNKYVPLAYDFDMSGFVDAPYAIVDAAMNVNSVRDRVYRGFCRKDNEVLQWVRKKYMESENKVMNVINSYSTYYTPNELRSMNAFITQFFATLKSDTKFQSDIIDKCRTK